MSARDRVLEAIQAGPADAQVGVSLVEILERVDAADRWLLSHRELDDALGTLHAMGLVRSVAPGRYVEEPGAIASQYTPLEPDAYQRALRAYRDDFAESVVEMTRQPFFANTGSPYLDPERVAITFILARVVEEFGGRLMDPVSSDPLEFGVNLPEGADVDALQRSGREALLSRSLGHRETWLRLARGGRVAVTDSTGLGS